MDQLPKEILFDIFSKLNVRSMVKFKLTCKRFLAIVEEINSNDYLRKKYVKYNDLTALLELLPDKPWNYYKLSFNSNVTLDIIKANPDKPWNYTELSKKYKITWDISSTDSYNRHEYEELLSGLKNNITWDISSTDSYNRHEYEELLSGLKNNITWDIIEKYDIQERRSLTMSSILSWKLIMNKLQNKVDFDLLSENEFGNGQPIYV